MPVRQVISDGVTVTWANQGAPRRRRPRRTSRPVTVRTVPVSLPDPSPEVLAAVAQGARRETLAKLLGAEISWLDPAIDLSGVVGSLRRDGVPTQTILLALVEGGIDDINVVRAVWPDQEDEQRAIVYVLVRRAGWRGDRVHAALAALGLGALDRAVLFDPTTERLPALG